MYERLSRFETTRPGDIRVPFAAYPSKPVQPLTRWAVRMEAAGGDWSRVWTWQHRVWAFSSTDATERARAEFYDGWATYEDRQRFPVRVVAVLQEGL